MGKTIRIAVACPQCTTKLGVQVAESDLGTKKQCQCPKCHKIFTVSVPMSLAPKFDSDPTNVGDNMANEVSLLLETVPNEFTTYQSFELTSDYYTIGRKNNSGPEYRADVEVMTTDMKMSRKHAAITKKGKIGFTLKDIRSKNGIKVNNGSDKMDAEEEIYLNDGDVFCLGQTQFKVSFLDQSTKGDDLTR